MSFFSMHCRFAARTDPSLEDREQGLSSDRKSIQRVVRKSWCRRTPVGIEDDYFIRLEQHD